MRLTCRPFGSASSEVLLFAKDRKLGFLLNPDPDDPLYAKAPQQFRAELHRRLTEWIYPIVFALIALAVAGDARSHREARIHPLVTVARRSRWWRAGWDSSPPTKPSTRRLSPLVYGVPFGFAAMSVWFIYAQRTMELPMPPGRRDLIALVRRLGDSVILVRHRLLGHRAPARGRA